jgi:ribonucleoside-diphosphate reductase alpha chain
METGTPYMVYKDKANLASNQKNLGVIKSSNLCAEIIEYTSPEEQAVCNLASIALNRFVVINKDETYFDFDKLRDVTKIIIKNLDNVIDQNYYPTAETEISNFNHRPVGLGVQGLADVFAMMKMNFDSQEARDLNKEIFENLYFASLESSNQLAKEKGSYSSFSGSPAHNGFLQFDMYNEKPVLKDYLDWDGLTHSIMKNGLRNSLLLALMPTASTSQILGNNECFEPFTSNLYLRRTLAGEYIVVNKHLVKDLEEVDLWNDSIRNQLKLSNGSVQGIYEIPQEIRDRYKTSYELSQKVIIDLAADRQRFVCQSQSMNLFIANPDFGKLSSMHLYAWKQGLKTGIYYLRSKSAVDAIKFTATKEAPKVSTTLEIDTSQEEEIKSDDYKEMIQRARNAQEDDDCEMCGS